MNLLRSASVSVGTYGNRMIEEANERIREAREARERIIYADEEEKEEFEPGERISRFIEIGGEDLILEVSVECDGFQDGYGDIPPFLEHGTVVFRRGRHESTVRSLVEKLTDWLNGA